MNFRFLLVGLFFITLTACGVEEANIEADVLRRSLSAQPESLDPLHARSVASLVVLGDLYEGLMTRDASGRLVNGLAVSVERTNNDRGYLFTLRSGLAWSDGSPLTAADFVRSWQLLAAPETAAFYADLLAPVARRDDGQLDIEAPSPQTFLVNLVAPQVDFSERLSHPALAPRAAKTSLTNGAYQLDADGRGYALTLRKNAHFYDAPSVSIATITYEWFEQEQTEYDAYRSGALDITSRVPRAVFRQTPRPDSLRTSPYLGVVYLSFNMRRPPTLTMRRQLAATVDRNALAQSIVGRGEQPAFGLIPPGALNAGQPYAAFQSNLEVTDPSPFADDLTLKINYSTSDENRVVATTLQQMWEVAIPGLRVIPENKEFRVLLAESRQGSFDGLVRGSWIADFNDATQFLNILATDAPSNTSGFSDARFDTLLAAIATTTDIERRASLIRAAEQLVAEQVPVIPLYFFVSKHFVHPRIGGWQDNPLDVHLSRYLSIKSLAVD
ncbi:MAG: peptide ABC transporter substrate-binding protein [Woeseiaceae bacterium]